MLLLGNSWTVDLALIIPGNTKTYPNKEEAGGKPYEFNDFLNLCGFFVHFVYAGHQREGGGLVRTYNGGRSILLYEGQRTWLWPLPGGILQGSPAGTSRPFSRRSPPDGIGT